MRSPCKTDVAATASGGEIIPPNCNTGAFQIVAAYLIDLSLFIPSPHPACAGRGKSGATIWNAPLQHAVSLCLKVNLYLTTNPEMSKVVKTKISRLLEEIDDEAVLNLLMEEVSFYASKKDIVDGLDEGQLNEPDKAIEEADNKETISWEDFKKGNK